VGHVRQATAGAAPGKAAVLAVLQCSFNPGLPQCQQLTHHVGQVGRPVQLGVGVDEVAALVRAPAGAAAAHLVASALDHDSNSDAAACLPHAGLLQAISAQHGTAQHSTARHSTAQHGTAWHGTARHSTAQRSAGPAMVIPCRVWHPSTPAGQLSTTRAEALSSPLPAAPSQQPTCR
jgi:hypothetical protein